MDLQVILLLAILGVSPLNAGPSRSLHPMNVYKDKVTLSGFSSGGSFAQMVQIAYSSKFVGIAVFSHTYYRCGPPDGKVDNYDRVCTKLFKCSEYDPENLCYDPDNAHKDIQDYHKRGLIEDPKNLQDKKLYVYTGLRNSFFTPHQSLNILHVYQRYMDHKSIFTRVQDSELVMPTNNRAFGVPCTTISDKQFYIGKCEFSGITEAMNFLLFNGSSNADDPFLKTPYNTVVGQLLEFDQTEFLHGLRDHNMDNTGFYYVPSKCTQQRTCYLHFYFHGCLSGRQFAGDQHVRNTGHMELAERKGIIMVFPQAAKTTPEKENSIGCWDTFGVSGTFYATQRGPQITAVKRMMDKIMDARSPGFSGGNYYGGNRQTGSHQYQQFPSGNNKHYG